MATDLLTAADQARLVIAIGAAERGHRGEIRCHLEGRYPGDGPKARAAELFEALAMVETAQGTGVLLYLATEDRKVAVHAGPGVPEPSSETWQSVATCVADGFRAGDGIGGLERGIARLGDVLRELLPGGDAHGDELPNAVTTS
ncbi:MAG: TPM domain-containing protein [Myxococcota bacterium]|nr:TPM domain-containing protein [Myxococcota bacterium]